VWFQHTEANTLGAHFLSVNYFFHRRGRELNLEGLLERVARGLVVPDGVEYTLGHDAAQVRSKLTGDVPHRSVILICPHHEHRIFVVRIVVFREKRVPMVLAENIRRIDVAHAHAGYSKCVCHGGVVSLIVSGESGPEQIQKEGEFGPLFFFVMFKYLLTYKTLLMGQTYSEPASCDKGFIKVDGTCMTMDTLKSNFKLIEYSQWEGASEDLQAEIQETGRLKGELTVEKLETGRLSGELTSEKLETGRLSGELANREETIEGLQDDLGEAKEHYTYTPDAKLCSYLHQRLQCNVDQTQCTMLRIDKKAPAEGSEFSQDRNAESEAACSESCLNDDTCIGASFDNSCYIIRKWGVGVHRDGNGTFMFKSCENERTAQLHADIMGTCPDGNEMAEHHAYAAENRHKHQEKTDTEILAHHLLTEVLPHQIPVNATVYHDFWSLPDNFGIWTNRMKVGTCADGSAAAMVDNTKYPTISTGKGKIVRTPVTIRFDDNPDELPMSGKRYRITDEMSSLPIGSFIQMTSQQDGVLVNEKGNHIGLDQNLVAGTRFTLEPLKQSYSCGDEGVVECETPIVGGVCGGNPTPEDCKKTCDEWPACQGFYHNDNNECMFYDSSCYDIDNCENHYIYGNSATRISGVPTKEEGRYTLGYPLDYWIKGHEGTLTPTECDATCQSQPECLEEQVTCRSMLAEHSYGNICYCDATKTILACDSSTYARYENKKAVKSGYNRTLAGPYGSREEASKACNAVNLKLCKRNAVRSTCEYGFTEDAADPGMFIERITEERQKTTPAECEGKTREQCAGNCVWGHDDQTGDFACRGSWWFLCGNESGMWHFDEAATGGAHCCN